MNDKNISITANAGAVVIVGIITAGLAGCFLGSRKTSLEKFKYKRVCEDRLREIQEEINRRQVELRGSEVLRDDIAK